MTIEEVAWVCFGAGLAVGCVLTGAALALLRGLRDGVSDHDGLPCRGGRLPRR